MATMNQSWNIRQDSSHADHRVSTDGEARNEPQRTRATDEEVRKDWNALDLIWWQREDFRPRYISESNTPGRNLATDAINRNGRAAVSHGRNIEYSQKFAAQRPFGDARQGAAEGKGEGTLRKVSG